MNRDTIQQMIDRYEELHLLEPIKSRFRASKVLLKMKQDVIQQLIDDYKELHLLEPIESGFRASAVLLKNESGYNLSTD